jgi:phosphoserine phosphatase RsbU/P
MQSHSEFAMDPSIAAAAGERRRMADSGVIQDESRGSDPEMAVSARLEAVRDRLDAEILGVLLWNEPEISLICRHGGEMIEAGPVDLAFAAIFSDTPEEAFPRFGEDPELVRLVEQIWGVSVHDLLCLPLRIPGETAPGVVIAVTGPPPHGFDSGDYDYFDTAVEMLSLAVANARARRILDQLNETNRELELAAEIQRKLLPTLDPSQSPVQGLNRPARTVSGDFYDYLSLPDGRFPFALGDVSGKGMKAALLMSKTASLFRCLAKTIDDPAELLGVINREICETATQGMFVTMVTGVYDSVSGVVRFANAGHEPPLLRRPDRSYVEFPADAPPIGILEALEFETEEAEIGGGELYIFSDGLTEFAHGEGEMLGVTGLIQMVEVSSTMPLAERLNALLATLEEGGWSTHDDLTALTIDGAWVRRDG